MPAGDSTNLNELLAGIRGRAGVIWALVGSRDLNVNLVRFDAGEV